MGMKMSDRVSQALSHEDAGSQMILKEPVSWNVECWYDWSVEGVEFEFLQKQDINFMSVEVVEESGGFGNDAAANVELQHV